MANPTPIPQAVGAAAVPAAPTDVKWARGGKSAVLNTYVKLHEGKLGAHWLWCVIERIASGASQAEAFAEYGYELSASPSPASAPAECGNTPYDEGPFTLAGAPDAAHVGDSQQWKRGDEFLPFHPSASHVPADYRDGWNRCYWMSVRRASDAAHVGEPAAVPEPKSFRLEWGGRVVAWGDAIDYGKQCYEAGCATPTGVAADESTSPEPQGMRAAFMAWVEDQGCDTDGAWSAWQGCWDLLSAQAADESTRAPDGPTDLEQTLAGLVKRLARRLHPEDNLRVTATEYLQREGFFNPLRASGERTSAPAPNCGKSSSSSFDAPGAPAPEGSQHG